MLDICPRTMFAAAAVAAAAAAAVAAAPAAIAVVNLYVRTNLAGIWAALEC